MPRVILNDEKNDRQVLLEIDADYDNGAFLSLQLSDAKTNEQLLDLTTFGAKSVGALYDSFSEGFAKFFLLNA